MRGYAAIALAAGVSASTSKHPRDQADRAQAVKDAFKLAWDGYSSTCKTDSGYHDELLPQTGDCGDSRNGWGASAIDALGTAAIMGLTDVVDEILTHVENTDFTNAPASNDHLNVFESTIRYLGGLLSAYDLLNEDGPFFGVASNQDQVRFLQNQTLTLAQGLRIGYDTPLNIPDNELNLETRSNGGSDTNSIACAALQLEYARLADMWNDPTYKIQAEAVQPYLSNPDPAASPLGPGMIGARVEIETGDMYSEDGVYKITWGGGSDSYYEYLLKYWVYDPSKTDYLDTWKAAADTTIKKLASSPNVNENLMFIAESQNTDIQYKSGHLNSFHGGNFILGGMLLNNSDYLNLGLQIADSCGTLYNSTATGIGPESFQWSPDGNDVPEDKADFYNENGFWITNGLYDLRPEIIETWYYAYRATGDEKYRDYVWDAFNAILKYCKTGNGFSSINDVNNADTSSDDYYKNLQESFFFAEVLKYAYIIFIDDAPYHVAKPGEETTFVFSTEAHPLKIKSKSHNGYNPGS